MVHNLGVAEAEMDMAAEVALEDIMVHPFAKQAEMAQQVWSM
jgi:hypothetical protein